MAKFSSLLSLRFGNKEAQNQKISALAERSKNGNTPSFSNVFQQTPLSSAEKDTISTILKTFEQYEGYDSAQDLNDLIAITSEVKAITNQAVMLHGERIKKAQTILKNYKEGCFTAWLIATYGNRQTPYNFLQYFEFYSSMKLDLHPLIDSMPRQAVYALASRDGDLEKKEEIVKNYQGESKQEILNKIRSEFPLDRDDKRLPNIASQSISSLLRLKNLFTHSLFEPTSSQKEKIHEILEDLFKMMKRH
jgi:hypothetical protein